MAYDIKGLLGTVVIGLIGIFLVMTLFSDLFGDTNTAVDDLNGTMTDAGYETSGNLVITGWKIAQLGLVFVVLVGFGIALFSKATGKL
jgi:hypothetical protein